MRRKARYAPLEDIDRIARPVAARHGLTWTWDTKIEGPLMHVACRVMHVMGHSETTSVSMPWESKAGSSPQQKYGSAQTYGMRYSLVAALGITTADEDTDGNEPGGEVDKISEEQAADLNSLIDEVGADRPKFLEWASTAAGYEVRDVADLPKSKLPEALRLLEARRRRTA